MRTHDHKKSIVSALGIAVGATAAATVGLPATARADSTTFQTPSGNITCAMLPFNGANKANCQIIHYTYQTPPKSPDCNTQGRQLASRPRQSQRALHRMPQRYECPPTDTNARLWPNTDPRRADLYERALRGAVHRQQHWALLSALARLVPVGVIPQSVVRSVSRGLTDRIIRADRLRWCRWPRRAKLPNSSPSARNGGHGNTSRATKSMTLLTYSMRARQHGPLSRSAAVEQSGGKSRRRNYCGLTADPADWPFGEPVRAQTAHGWRTASPVFSRHRVLAGCRGIRPSAETTE